ncbi:MAG: Rab family GTPase [Candidatus Kariarchaeaceae archaeon]|jgi:small GTP-binding protein
MIESGKKSYKIIILGDPAVGKSSIRRRYLGEGFSGAYNMTLGADFAIKRLGDRVLQIWDLAGHRLFRDIREVYYAGAEGVILVFDLTRLETLNNLYTWIDEAFDIRQSKIPFIVVGNKSDLYEEASLSAIRSVVKEFMLDLSSYTFFDRIDYIETSALLGRNVNEVFDNLVGEMDLIYADSFGIEYGNIDQTKPSISTIQHIGVKKEIKYNLPKLPDLSPNRPVKKENNELENDLHREK